MISYSGLNNITWFIGYVEVPNDPTGHGRIKVRAFGFHPTIEEGLLEDEDLPWAFVIRPNSHQFAAIERGEMVIGFFLDGREAQHPVVLGVISTAKFGMPAASPRTPQQENSSDPSAGGSSAALEELAANKDIPAHGRAFLDTIAAKESNGKYDIRNGGSSFDINNGHPGKFSGPGGTSSASGRYQFTYDTWVELNGGINAPMTRENQDAAAWKLAQQRYRAYTGGDLNNELVTNGISTKLLSDLSPTWEAFGRKDWQNSLVATYQGSMSKIGAGVANALGANTLPAEGINSFIAEAHDIIDNFGNLALPPQLTGEDLHKTPILAVAASRKEATSRSGSYSIQEPSIPVGGNHRSSVWNTRYDGSYIELHAGQNKESEFINIVHSSGASVRLDQNGNVTIKSSGKVHIASDNDYEENIDGFSTNVSKSGYRISVTSGKIDIDSSGDMNFTSGGNINMQAAGDILMNAGESIDIAGARLAAHARVGNIDIVAADQLTLQSDGLIGVKTSSVVGVQANGIGLKAVGNINVKGGKIYLNDAAGTPADVADAGATRAPNPPTKGFTDDAEPDTSPTPISPDMMDDVNPSGSGVPV